MAIPSFGRFRRSIVSSPEEPSSLSSLLVVKEYDKTVSYTGTSLTHETDLKFFGEILLIIIRPEVLTTTYKVKVTETQSGVVIEEARATRTGQYVIWKRFPVSEDTLTIKLTSISATGSFRFRVRYR